MLTGCRKNEIVKLHWGEVRIEEGVLRLRDSKTGRKDVILSQEAIQLLRGIKGLTAYTFFPARMRRHLLKDYKRSGSVSEKKRG